MSAYIIQLTSARTRTVKYLKAHHLRGGKIVTTRHRDYARKFKSETEAQEFTDKVSPYFGYVWTVIPSTQQLINA